VIGSFFQMAVPFIVILPRLLGLVVLQKSDGSFDEVGGRKRCRGKSGCGVDSYNEVLPLMMVR